MTKTKWPLLFAILFACVQIAPVLLIFSFLIGVAHFGFVSGPDKTPLRWASYFFSTVPALTFFAAYRLRAVVEKYTEDKLTIPKALVIMLPAIVALNLSQAIITLAQIGDDTTVFIIGVLYALVSIMSLSYLFSNSQKNNLQENKLNVFGKKTTRFLLLLSFFISFFILVGNVEYFNYLGYIDFSSKNPNFLTMALFLLLILLPLLLFLTRWILLKVAEGKRGLLFLLTLGIALCLQYVFIMKVVAWFSPISLLRQADEYFIAESWWDARNHYEFITEMYPGFATKNPVIKSRLETSNIKIEETVDKWFDSTNK